MLFGTIPTPAYDLKFKIMDLEFMWKVCVKVFKISLNPSLGLFYI